MKILMRILTTTMAVLIFSTTYAYLLKQKMETLSHHRAIAAPFNYLKIPVAALTKDDSLKKLKENYPLVYENLIKNFTYIQSLKYSMENKVLYLSFTSNGHRVDACFSQSGFLRYSVSYMATALPKSVIEKIKTEYPAYTIFYGKSIRVTSETIYQVFIENNFEYRVINFSNEEMEEIKKIKKHFVK